MRSVHLNDVLRLVRVLIATPDAQRAALCQQVLRAAELADRRAKRGLGGGAEGPKGTLQDALADLPAAGTIDLDDPTHCACFGLAFAQLRRRPRNTLL